MPAKKNKLTRLYSRLYRSFGPQHWWPAKTRFEVIVGAILAQNTSWRNVEKAICNLAAENLLTPEALKKVRRGRLARLIRPSGYYNLKAARLADFVGFLFKKYNGSLRKMFSQDTVMIRQELLEVKGLGEETVDSILLYAGKKPVFVVDAYTKRILSRHGIISEGCDYGSVQKLFMENIPKDAYMYNEYHALLVRLAKDMCTKAPDCCACPARKIL